MVELPEEDLEEEPQDEAEVEVKSTEDDAAPVSEPERAPEEPLKDAEENYEEEVGKFATSDDEDKGEEATEEIQEAAGTESEEEVEETTQNDTPVIEEYVQSFNMFFSGIRSGSGLFGDMNLDDSAGEHEPPIQESSTLPEAEENVKTLEEKESIMQEITAKVRALEERLNTAVEEEDFDLAGAPCNFLISFRLLHS